jgi:hypothetical protein
MDEIADDKFVHAVPVYGMEEKAGLETRLAPGIVSDGIGQVAEEVRGRRRFGMLRIGAPRRRVMPSGPMNKVPRTGMT